MALLSACAPAPRLATAGDQPIEVERAAPIVVSSSGPSAGRYRPGSRLVDEELELELGDTVTVLSQAGTRRFIGPGRFPVGRSEREVLDLAAALGFAAAITPYRARARAARGSRFQIDARPGAPPAIRDAPALATADPTFDEAAPRPIFLIPQRPAVSVSPAAASNTSLNERCAKIGILDPAKCVDYDAAVASLETGLSAFKLPRRMTQGRATSVALAISLTPTDEAVSRSLQTIQGLETLTRLKVARYMSAQLSGGGFTIEPAGPIRKQLGRLGPTIWEWRVTPKEAGAQVLRLESTVHLSLAGGVEEQEPLPVLSQVVNVDVQTPVRGGVVTVPAVTRAAKDAGDLLTSLGGLIAALLGVMAALGWRKKRRRRAAPAAT